MKTRILTCVASLALTGTAIAQAPAGTAPRAGGDFTRADATAMVDRLFARVDLNQDGKITREEMQAARQQYAQGRPGSAPGGEPRGGGGMGMFPGFGADGSITLEQARAMALGHFDQMDADGDGIVTQAERQAMLENRNRMIEQGMGGARPKARGKGKAD